MKTKLVKIESLDQLEVGMWVNNEDGRRKLLAKTGFIITLSGLNSPNTIGPTFVLEQVNAFNYQLEVPEKRWKPEEGEWYENVDEFGEVNEASWRDDDIDNKRWKLGNCFKKDSAEAQKAAEELKAWWLDRINNQK